MSCPAKDVVDPTKQKEDGDPWLLAQALELCAAGFDVTVVTEDQKDNPTRIASPPRAATLVSTIAALPSSWLSAA